jgi:hypothetical protein
MTPDELRQIVREELARTERFQADVMTTETASQYTGMTGSRFYRTMREWGVTPCGEGLWSRKRIDRAMRSVAKQTHVSNRGRRAS